MIDYSKFKTGILHPDRAVKYLPKKILRYKSRDFLLKKMPKNSICAEIGVHLGGFSERILKIVNPKALHLIDPWKYEHDETYSRSFYGRKTGVSQVTMDKRYESVLKRFATEIDSGQVVVHRGHSGLIENFNDGFFDWVYIDGNHLYDFVKKDLELSNSKVRRKGFIVGDDYDDEGWWQGGVKKAVDEFITKDLVELIEIRNIQFILKKH